MRQFDENSASAPRFHFYFDQDLQLKKASIFQADVGSFDFVAIVPFTEREFEEKDWYMFECEQIQEEILQEHNNFVSFSTQLVRHLLGHEDDILKQIGYTNNKGDLINWVGKMQKESKEGSEEQNDEDFDD